MLIVLKNRRAREGAAKRDSGDNQAARAPLRKWDPFCPLLPLPWPQSPPHCLPPIPPCPPHLALWGLLPALWHLIGPAGPWPPGWLLDGASPLLPLLPVVTVLREACPQSTCLRFTGRARRVTGSQKPNSGSLPETRGSCSATV